MDFSYMKTIENYRPANLSPIHRYKTMEQQIQFRYIFRAKQGGRDTAEDEEKEEEWNLDTCSALLSQNAINNEQHHSIEQENTTGTTYGPSTFDHV